jgi:hypothetical protein
VTTTLGPPSTTPTTSPSTPLTTVLVPTPIPSGVPTGIGEPDASGQGPVFWFFVLVVGVGGGIVGSLGVAWWVVGRKQQ